MPELMEAAHRWLVEDPDPVTRDQLQSLLDAAEDGSTDAMQTLRDCFAGPLEFGTAGLRGALGPGPNRMNRIVVAQAAAGLAAYLVDHGGGAVIIGYDARHNSDVFARESAEVFAGAGLETMVLPEVLPTPVLAFAVKARGCSAGVMVTASHNPPQDNGYKVYLRDGSQIVQPVDQEISRRIAQVAERPYADIPRSDAWLTLDDSIRDAYVKRVASLIPADAPRQITTVYTAMHGVGGAVLEDVFRAAGFPTPVRVRSQFDADPDFPSVAFPNPEEPGAMDAAVATARESSADLVLANDPDADRCAVAVPFGDSWRTLHGDEIGALLGWWLTQRPLTIPMGDVMAQSLVSGGMLQPIAESHGFRYERTLTGFKWIARIPGLAYGYEEALGYCVDPTAVADKDGISAALVITFLAAHLKAEGRTLLDALDDLARRYGVYASGQISKRVADLRQIDAVMARLRSSPPESIGGLPVQRVTDLALGAWGLPGTEGVFFELADEARVIVRPSGTEPKIKAYLQAVVFVRADDVVAARDQADQILIALGADVLGLLT
jgi:phosphomannomutase